MLDSRDLLREVGSYPITEFFRVEIGDVDNVNYFNGNVGESIKCIEYRDESAFLKRKEFFTYEEIAGVATNVKRVLSSTSERFLGGYGSNATPTVNPNGFYFITVDSVTINGILFVKNEVLGCVDTGYGIYRWKKCKLNSDNELVEII